jgi:uncharacterized protein (TIGR04255 family)
VAAAACLRDTFVTLLDRKKCKAQCKILSVSADSKEALSNSNPRRRLLEAPLILVLSEVRFAPVLHISSFVPDLQERLRGTGFPGYEAGTVQQLQISASGPQLTAENRWIFSSRDRTRFVVLGSGSVALQVTSYGVFEEFLQTLEPVIRAVQEIVRPEYASRVGLRYVNAASLAEHRLEDLFQDSVLSFRASELAVDSLSYNQQIIGNFDGGQIVIKTSQTKSGSPLPAELASPELAHIVESMKGDWAILDLDGSLVETREFSYEELEAALWKIHSYTERGFWSSTTKLAHEVWKLAD